MKVKPYDGKLGYGYAMSDDVKRGYNSWREQKRRCYYKSYVHYKYYGSRGIRVLYTCREFVAWWLENLKTFTGERPITSRIDHSGNYCFENIKIESLSDNSRESAIRNNLQRFGGAGKKPIHIIDVIDGSILMTCPSIKDAYLATKIEPTYISDLLKNNRPPRNGRSFGFKYMEIT